VASHVQKTGGGEKTDRAVKNFQKKKKGVPHGYLGKKVEIRWLWEKSKKKMGGRGGKTGQTGNKNHGQDCKGGGCIFNFKPEKEMKH